jgi:hypothetical protein
MQDTRIEVHLEAHGTDESLSVVTGLGDGEVAMFSRIACIGTIVKRADR